MASEIVASICQVAVATATAGPRLPLVAVEAPTSVVLPNTTCSVVSLPPLGVRMASTAQRHMANAQ